MQKPSTRTPPFRRPRHQQGPRAIARRPDPENRHRPAPQTSGRNNWFGASHRARPVSRDNDWTCWRSSRRSAQTESQISNAQARRQARKLDPRPNKKIDTTVTDLPWGHRQVSGISIRIGNPQAILAGNVGTQVLGFLCQSDDALMTGITQPSAAVRGRKSNSKSASPATFCI